MPRRARPEEQEAILADALERAAPAAPRGVVVCDLDSTLLDNRPRLARILQDYGRPAGLPELHRRPARALAGLVAGGSARAAPGSPPALVEAHAAPARRFWAEWFFTSAYCRLDVPLPGAPAFVRALVAAGAQAGLRERPARPAWPTARARSSGPTGSRSPTAAPSTST